MRDLGLVGVLDFFGTPGSIDQIRRSDQVISDTNYTNQHEYFYRRERKEHKELEQELTEEMEIFAFLNLQGFGSLSYLRLRNRR